MKEQMKVAYIAGPFRAATAPSKMEICPKGSAAAERKICQDGSAWEILQNVRRAEVLALKVAMLGIMPLCPHTNTQNFHGTITDKFWLTGTMELMRRCDIIVVTDDWKSSEGARAEVEEAQRLGKPVLTYAELLEVEPWNTRCV